MMLLAGWLAGCQRCLVPTGELVMMTVMCLAEAVKHLLMHQDRQGARLPVC
jgi:hypothetical protein